MSTPAGTRSTAEPCVSVEGVSKHFRRSGVPRSLKESIVRPRSWFTPAEEFWALKDVSVQIEAGETLGIIGDNGSGKSTLLKLLAGILRPTAGTVQVRGSVAPLLELGVGFHGDLTGRENVFMNGAILGLDRREMRTRLADIVDFAELWPFIDTPVRAYSSGMIVRLGFAIAVQVDPDILLVDEVLAVGDQAFQAKCFDAIGDLKRRGKTIIFVTHSVAIVQRMCTRAMWLSAGRLASIGTPDKVVGDYLMRVEEHEAETVAIQVSPVAPATPAQHGRARVVGLEARKEGRPAAVLDSGEAGGIAVGFRAGLTDDDPLSVAVSVFAVDGTRCLRLEATPDDIGPMAPDQGATIDFDLSYVPLSTGTYYATVELHDRQGLADLHDRAYSFRVRKQGSPWGVASAPYTVRIGKNQPVQGAPAD